MVSCSRRRKSTCRSPCKWTVGKGCSQKKRSKLRSRSRRLSKSPKLTRCPNGYRRNKNTGRCEHKDYKLKYHLIGDDYMRELLIKEMVDGVLPYRLNQQIKGYLNYYNMTKEEAKRYLGVI